MLKEERLRKILELCDIYGTVSVKQMQDELNVSDMTIRRDLAELAEENRLVRVHGGARSVHPEGSQQVSQSHDKELSHSEKKAISIREKRYVAETAATLIDNDETIFLGTGTTIELMTEFLQNRRLRIVTNSLPIVNLVKDQENFDIYLVGGNYRSRTGAFVGSTADEMIQKFGISKAFVGANGVNENHASTFNIEEGRLQQLALDKAAEKYLLADAHKFDHSDFYNFYDLGKIDGIITDDTISDEVKKRYEQYTKIIN